jgi:hypothetical protein
LPAPAGDTEGGRSGEEEHRRSEHFGS